MVTRRSVPEHVSSVHGKSTRHCRVPDPPTSLPCDCLPQRSCFILSPTTERRSSLSGSPAPGRRRAEGEYFAVVQKSGRRSVFTSFVQFALLGDTTAQRNSNSPSTKGRHWSHGNQNPLSPNNPCPVQRLLRFSCRSIYGAPGLHSGIPSSRTIQEGICPWRDFYHGHSYIRLLE